MPRVEHSFIFSDPAVRVWRVISDISHWDDLWRHDTLFTSFKPHYESEGSKPLAPSTRFTVSNRSRILQTWEIAQWRPPDLLEARLVRLHIPFLQAEAFFRVQIKALDVSSSQVHLILDSKATRPSAAAFLSENALARRGMDSALSRLAERLTLLLDELGNA